MEDVSEEIGELGKLFEGWDFMSVTGLNCEGK